MEAMLRVLGVLLGGVGERAEMRPGDWCGRLWAKRKDPQDVSVPWILFLTLLHTGKSQYRIPLA